MLTIWKFGLPLEDKVAIEMPEGAKVLSVGVQQGNPCIWAMVNARAPKVLRSFYVHGTGHRVDIPYDARFIGTIQLLDGGLVFHVFDPASAQ